MKRLTILTNFGCHFQCSYCLLKNNNIKIPKTTVEGLKDLRETILSLRCGQISIMGADPLYQIDKHLEGYAQFFNIIKGLNITTELHTMNFMISYPSNLFDRIVYDLRDINDIAHIHRWKDTQYIRVVFVVTKDFSPQYIEKIYTEVKKNPNIDSLGFCRLVLPNWQYANYCDDFLRSDPRWTYIEPTYDHLYYAENQIYFNYNDFYNK